MSLGSGGPILILFRLFISFLILVLFSLNYCFFSFIYILIFVFLSLLY